MGKKKKRTTGNKWPGKSRKWWAGFLAVVLFCIFTLSVAFYVIFLHQAGVEPKSPESVLPEETSQRDLAPTKTFEPRLRKMQPAPRVEIDDRPLVAIVIDDMGYKKELGKHLLNLELALSFAFLPGAPHTESLAREAHLRGRDVLLHLPMEPMDNKWDPGPGALFVSMSEVEIASRFQDGLAAVPGVIGVNNHMGSRFTAYEKGMRVVLDLAGERGLFFLDSITSANSIGFRLAGRMGVKTGRRQVFLDNTPDEVQVLDQLFKLVELAGKQGEAIAIGHPHAATLEALLSAKEELLTRVRVVGVSRLMH